MKDKKTAACYENILRYHVFTVLPGTENSIASVFTGISYSICITDRLEPSNKTIRSVLESLTISLAVFNNGSEELS